MVLPLLGAGLMLGGTAANLYGTHQRDKATRGAMRNYQNAVNERTAQERGSLEQERGLLSGLADERQRGIGSYLTDLSAAQFPGTDEGFTQRNTGALNDIRELTKGADGTYAYSGAPQAQAAGMQQERTGTDNKQLAESLLADYTLGQIQNREQSAGHRRAFGDIMRQSKGASLQQRFQLAKALRDLDWQRKTAAMQGQLDEAQKKGQWMNVLGGLGTQAGGMLMMAGGGGADAAGVPSGAMQGPSGGAEGFAAASQYGASGGGPSIYNFTG